MTYWEFLDDYGIRYVDGMVTTVLQFVLAALLTIVMALIAGLMKLSSMPVLSGVARVYIEFFRGTSLLVQLFWLFYVLPLFGLTFDKFVIGFVAVGLNYGAYGAEIVRGAVRSVPRGQWEASYALSMTPAQQMRRIILPQAVLAMLPPWGNIMIEVLKGTALVALIGVADLMFQARQINAATYYSIQAFGTALILYYVFARLIVTPAMRGLERWAARRMGRT